MSRLPTIPLTYEVKEFPTYSRHDLEENIAMNKLKSKSKKELHFQMCFTPNRFIDIHNNTWASTKKELAFAKSLGVSRMNVWFLVGELFHETNSFDKLNPEAEACYQDLIMHCNRLGMGVIGKIGHWNIPWWFDHKQGIPARSDSMYGKHLDAHAHIAHKLYDTFDCAGWMSGNEPFIESYLYGYGPNDGPLYRLPQDEALQTAIDKTRVVAPIFGADGKLTIGHCMEGLMWSLSELGTYWKECSTYLDYMGVNAYMPQPGYPTWANYGQPYSVLNQVAPLYTSEQNIPREWKLTLDALEVMIGWTKNFASYFSYFVLTEIRDSDKNWCIIFGDGRVDEMRTEFLRERFRREVKTMYFPGH